MQILKGLYEKLADDVVQSMVGKYVYAKTNYVSVLNETTGQVDKVNNWFGGFVVGYNKEYLLCSKEDGGEFEIPVTTYQVILSDEMAYVLGDAEVMELTKEEYTDLYKQFEDGGGERQIDV